MFCAGFCFAFFNFLGKIFRKWLTIRGIAGIITPVVRHGTNIWGISSAGSPVGIKTHPQSDGPATINSQQKTPSKRFASWILWGISSAGRALAWHARGHRFDPGILHQKSTVLRRKYGAFLFAEAGFWGCIASPAPFSGFCRRFLYTPQLLTLHHFQKGMFAARFFSRLLHHPPQ